MSAKHTPGPWTIARSSRGYPYQIDAPNGSCGPGGIRSVTRWAAISLPTSAEGEANARLIAAAPDMLSALKAIDDFWTDAFPDGPDGAASALGGLLTLTEDTLAVWRKIRAAIARAEGAP